MKILLPDWKSFCIEDIRDALESMEHTVVSYTEEPKNYRIDPKYKSTLKKFIKQNCIDIIFSCNYNPVLSDACNDLKILYISWCYDSPLILTYSKTVFNPCNRIFIFDTKMVSDLQRLGVPNVYYMPLAVNAERLEKLTATPEQQQLIKADVSFVGSLYTQKHTLYDRMTNLDKYTKGYLEGVMAAQRLIYGESIIENTLTPDIINSMQKAMPLEESYNSFESPAYTYANYFIARKITQTERTEMIQAAAGVSKTPLKLYTSDNPPSIENVQNMGTISYMQEMPLVFRHSKINLNISLRSIVNGIPLRAMDIMGAGGFLLTNYQNDFTLHFTEGQDYVYYDSTADMLDKIKYYLNHENERRAIAESGHKRMVSEHTYKLRLAEIFDLSGI